MLDGMGPATLHLSKTLPPRWEELYAVREIQNEIGLDEESNDGGSLRFTLALCPCFNES